MKVASTALGPQWADPQSQIVFPQGIPGFESKTRYQLFQPETSEEIGYLQSLDDPDLTFSVVSPDHLNIFYEFSLSDDEVALIELAQPEDVAVLVLVYRQTLETQAADLSAGGVNANFMAPLVVNVRQRLGLQKVLGQTERRITIRAD